MARSNEPLFWGPFSAGMLVDAFLIPALIIITGIVLPLFRAGDATRFQGLVNNGFVRFVLFVVISLSFFHWAHRFRYILFDLGVKGARTGIAAACYGLAIAGTVVAGLIALHVV